VGAASAISGVSERLRAVRWRRWRPLIALAAVLGTAVVAFGHPSALFVAQFGGRDRLLTNEYALHNPHARGIARSRQWIVTSGSLFIRSGTATNGRLDHVAPNARSSNGTNSAVFRAYTRQLFSGSYRVRFDLRVGAPQAVPGLAPGAWDGVHLIVDAQSPQAAYYVSLFRRDAQVVIKKKTAGGPVAGGTYHQLSHYVRGPIAPGPWSEVQVDVRQAGEKTAIALYEDGSQLVSATDDLAVSGSAPYVGGRLGIRADKTTFAIKNLTVSQL
jgi:hypothetical protein